MTKTLTEQWRDGTIEYGLYYVRIAYRNDITIAHTIEEDLNVEEVLAPVPSYEELREKEVIYNTTSRCNETLLWENESLKNKVEKLKEQLEDKVERLQEQIKKLQHYRDRAHKALVEISRLTGQEMDSGKAWDIARDAILCLNEISGGVK